MSNDDNDTTSKLGFRLGSEVKFSIHFFSNHNLKFVSLGTGTVEGKKMPGINSLPKVIVKFPFNREFLITPQLQKLIIPGRTSDREIWIEIHPVYLEKVKRR